MKAVLACCLVSLALVPPLCDAAEETASTPSTIRVLLGAHYTDSRERETREIPVHVIQKTGSDLTNAVILICAEGYTAADQAQFVADANRMWAGVAAYEPYRTFAHRFNVYAVGTVSAKRWSVDNAAGDTFFGSVYKNRALTIPGSPCKNHIFERCVGPAFIRDVHDARRQEPFKDPDLLVDENGRWIDENEPYFDVYDHIDAFVMLANSTAYMGASVVNRDYGFQYATSSAGASSVPILAHELGHALLHLGDEYISGAMTEATANASLNVSNVGDPERLRWKTLLGFHNSYPVPYVAGGGSFNSSRTCLMGDTGTTLCELCRLQGAKRIASILADGDKGLYVAVPELETAGERYVRAGDFTPATYQGFADFLGDRSARLLSGTGRALFDAQCLGGKALRLRTVVQNFSPTEARRLKLVFSLTSSGGEIIKTDERVFEIPPWEDRERFDLGGRHRGWTGPENFDSGLANLELGIVVPTGLSKDVAYAYAVVDVESGATILSDKSSSPAYFEVSVADGEKLFFPDESEAVNKLIREAAEKHGVARLKLGEKSPPLAGLDLFENVPIRITPPPSGGGEGEVSLDYAFGVSEMRFAEVGGAKGLILGARVSAPSGAGEPTFAPKTRLGLECVREVGAFADDFADARELTEAERAALNLNPKPGEKFLFVELDDASTTSPVFIRIRAGR